jgi:glycosyltransferase involved in cell wall biosynthesis
VLKEAATLKNAGWDIRIIAALGVDTEPHEERDGFRIFRVALVTVRLASLLGSYYSGSSVAREKNTASGEVREPEKAGQPFGKRGLVRAALSKTGSRLLRLPVVSYVAYLRYVEYHWRAFWLAWREPADVYHAHDLMTLPVAWLLKRVTGGKLVYDCHELWLDRNRASKRSRLNRFFVGRVESFLIRRTDANMVVSDSIAAELATRYRIPKPAVVVNAPDYRPVERSNLLRGQLGIPAEDRIVLYVGFITFKRGLEELIRSLRYLNACAVVLMGYGDGGYLAGLKKLIADEGWDGKVHFFGPVPHEEVTRYAASADVGVATIRNACLSYYYCSPNKVFEYVAAGLPVVGSNFPDLKKVIEGHRLGVVVDPESPRDIARAIEYILSDKSRYQEMRKNALEAAKVYNWNAESEKLLLIYRGLGVGVP